MHQRLNGWAADADATATTRRIETIVARMDQLAPDGHMAHQARMILAHERRDWAAFLALARNAAAQHLRPGPHAGYGWALILHGRPDEAVEPLETAVRLSPRDALRAEWQYRLAWAHFMAGRDDLTCEWAETAALANPELAWPPLLAAALARQGQWQPAREALAAYCRRHPDWRRSFLERRLPAASPAMQKARDALLVAVATLD
jgi:tetratricopeptide (TPR) repeat protein